jgi:hypothetical protein
MSDDTMVDEFQIFGRKRSDLFDALSQHLPGGTE